MVANSDRTCPLPRRILVAASAFAMAFSLSAVAQTASAPDNSGDGQGYSSSADYRAYLSTDDLLGGSTSATPMASAAASASPSPQYGGNRSSYPSYEGKWSHIAFVGGGGFSAPIGNDTHGYETWGYNFDVGGGWNFTKHVGVLFEYQFDRMKIPGSTLANAGVQGGNINSHLFLFNPIYYQPIGRTKGAYITGGAGFSRKVTNFTNLEEGEQCYYFCYYVTEPVTVDSFSSTQAAADAGLGFYWKAFGPDSKAKLFAEARYIFVDSPKPTTTAEGEGTEEIIPVTFGIRF
jgi:hypothetical protein